MKKRILIIIIAILVVLGGVFVYQYYAMQNANIKNQNDSAKLQNEAITYIKVTSPKGGEIFKEGQDFTITWQSKGINNVYIRVVSFDDNLPEDSYYKSGECRLTFEPIPAFTGIYIVKGGGQSKCGTVPAGAKLKVQISDQDSQTTVLSDNYFSIVK